MWRDLQNLFYGLNTYFDLSPDLQVRRQINARLEQRPYLSSQDWFRVLWRPQNVSAAVAEFAYTYLEEYSGLTFAKVRPGDRLNEDLRFPEVCWFDWHLHLCDDFYEQFGVDISDRLDIDTLSTIEELILFLHQELRTKQQSI